MAAVSLSKSLDLNNHEINNQQDNFTASMFFCNDLETIELRQITKMYTKLNLNEKKIFMHNILTLFNQESLRSLNLTLESLKHNDFCMRTNLTRIKSSKPDVEKSSKIPKLPLIAESRKQVLSSRPKYCSKNDSILKSALSQTSRKITSVRFHINSQANVHKHRDIDSFIRKKNVQALDEAYNFKIRNLASKPASSRITDDNVLGKIKQFFGAKRNGSNVKSLRRVEEKYSLDDELDREVSKIMTSSKSNTYRSFPHSGHHKNSIYLKKLKSNFYEKKILKSLGLNNERTNKFNIYSDKTPRNYISEFNIIKKWNLKSNDENPENENSCFDLDDDETDMNLIQKMVFEQSLKDRKVYLDEILNYNSRLKNWPVSRIESLLLLLINDHSHSILDFMRKIVEKRLKPILASIDHLPDHILLKIFSHLDDKSVLTSSLVCKRWFYLTNTQELWFYKCKMLGKKENLNRIETELINELFIDEDIDWKLAYKELKTFIKQLKTKYLTQINNFCMKQKQESEDDEQEKSVCSHDSFESEYDNFYTQVSNKFKSDTSSIYSSEKSKRSENNEKKESIVKTFGFDLDLNIQIEYEPDNNYDESEEGNGDFREIRMDLDQTKDILNHVKPNYKLRWKAKDESVFNINDNEQVLFRINSIDKVIYLNDHANAITCMDYDKKRLVTGGRDRVIYVYDLKDGKKIGKLLGHKGGIQCIQILSNRLCSGSWDSTVIIWNMYTFEKVVTISVNYDTITSLYFDSDYLIWGSHDKTINVWTFKKGYSEKNESNQDIRLEQVVKFECLISHHKAPVKSLSYDGLGCIISADISGFVLITDTQGNLIKELVVPKYSDPITCLRLVGALIITSTISGRVIFWNRRSNECETIIKCHDKAINSIAFFDQKFYTVGSDCMVKEWDLCTFTCLRKLKAHDSSVLDILVMENKMVTCDSGKVMIWYFKPKKEEKKENEKEAKK